MIYNLKVQFVLMLWTISYDTAVSSALYQTKMHLHYDKNSATKRSNRQRCRRDWTLCIKSNAIRQPRQLSAVPWLRVESSEQTPYSRIYKKNTTSGAWTSIFCYRHSNVMPGSTVAVPNVKGAILILDWPTWEIRATSTLSVRSYFTLTLPVAGYSILSKSQVWQM